MEALHITQAVRTGVLCAHPTHISNQISWEDIRHKIFALQTTVGRPVDSDWFTSPNTLPDYQQPGGLPSLATYGYADLYGSPINAQERSRYHSVSPGPSGSGSSRHGSPAYESAFSKLPEIPDSTTNDRLREGEDRHRSSRRDVAARLEYPSQTRQVPQCRICSSGGAEIEEAELQGGGTWVCGSCVEQLKALKRSAALDPGLAGGSTWNGDVIVMCLASGVLGTAIGSVYVASLFLNAIAR